ncbi:sigma-54-dependent transcriptional regulator [Clostridium sp.]|uniref:sigma-54-dependent transcriptional regulator n=1 Tax=Clostridium sp. TaxID=1506 RepID=UPI003D6CC5CD
MKNIDIVFKYISEKITIDNMVDSIKNHNTYGVDAAEIQEYLNIVRNNASTILSELWKTSKLVKINSRPVTFVPKTIIEALNVGNTKLLNNTFTTTELESFINNIKTENIPNDPFQHLIGSTNSLLTQIGQAKAAVIYPPKGLHTLILGESGVGKTTFAHAMYEFGKSKKDLSESIFPFISFNCSDYFNNPQLLLSQLFGHCKGAFTGAEKENIGLVEKANNGILFLDEIHRLLHEGQEMLFNLMDKGEYHRLGEAGKKRKSNILIIAATTENPSGTLLSTFLRRIPVLITLPLFAQKDISEKIEIIESLFSYESINLNMKIRVSPEVLKALALYEFKLGNIGQLKSEIRLLCAKFFLEHLQSNQELIIEFKMLDKELRDFVFNYNNISDDVKTYLNMFTENLIISPSSGNDYQPSKSKKDIYELIIKKVDDLKLKGLAKESIDLEISTLIENHFSNVMKTFNSNRLNIDQLYKLVSKDIADASAKLIIIAQQELSTKFNNKFIFAFAFHLQSLLKRIADKKPIVNPNVLKIKKDHPEEFRVAKVLVNLLNEKFNVIIPEDEKGFLTILLANNKLDVIKPSNIGLIVSCHGDSTASSMSNVANSLLNTDLVKAIDMPLDVNITETYNRIKTTALAINKGNGILFLVDMGSLGNLGKKLMNETGIKIKTIANVSTLLVIESLRNILYKDSTLEDIYASLINKDIPYFPINKLLDESFQKQFIKFLDTNTSTKNETTNDNKSVYETSKEMLEQYVKYINPKLAIININKFIEAIKLNYNSEHQDDIIDFIVHLGCMLDRCIHKDIVIFENIDDFKKIHINQFQQIKQAASILEKEYTININDAELCYIIKIINR